MRRGTFLAHKRNNCISFSETTGRRTHHRRPQNTPKWTKIKQKPLILALIYSMYSTLTYPQIFLLFENQIRILFHEVPEKYKFLYLQWREKLEVVLLVQDPKTMVKWTLVTIYGRFYITDYYQGKTIFESHMRMVFNEFLEKFTYSSFFRSVKKNG